MLFPWVVRESCEVDTEQKTGGSETSDSSDLRHSPLHGLFRWPGRVESQMRLLTIRKVGSRGPLDP